MATRTWEHHSASYRSLEKRGGGLGVGRRVYKVEREEVRRARADDAHITPFAPPFTTLWRKAGKYVVARP